MAAKYTHNYRAFDALVLCSVPMQGVMRRHAEKIADAAKEEATQYVDTGEYENSFEVTVTVGKAKGAGKRAIGHVTNTSPHAVYVEFGGPRSEAHHTLARALYGTRAD